MPRPRLDPERRRRLGDLSIALARALGSISELPPAPHTGDGPGRPGPAGTELSPLAGALLLLEGKLIPELGRSEGLPVIVAVQGGTNVGKSVVFNAICGKILSPSLVTASATKHPLLFAHERHRAALLEPRALGSLDCEALADPKQLITDPERTDVAYASFHDDPALEGVVVIDSPDFDGALATNSLVAARVAALSDLTIFVTTAQKYGDRALVEAMTRLLRLKGGMLVVMNQVDEEIIFRTLVDDLRETAGAYLGGERPALEAVQIPRLDARHPEDGIRARLAESLLPRLSDTGLQRLKDEAVARSLEAACALSLEVVEEKGRERVLKADIRRLARQGAVEAQEAYERGFRLALPEETLAVQTALRELELLRLLDLDPEVERSRQGLSLVGGSLRRCRDAFRRLLLKLCRSTEGTVEGSAAEYAAARDRGDGEHVARIAEGLRVRIESLLRKEEGWSPLARRLLSEHFTPSMPAELAPRVHAAHAELLAARRAEAGETVHERTRQWLEARPARTRLLRVGAFILKVGLGAAASWALPPASGLLGFLIQPLEWLYFAAGYMAGAYLVALIAARLLRRRAPFRRSRASSMRDALEGALLAPLDAFLDRAFSDEALRSVEQLVKKLRAAAPRPPGAPHGTGS